MASPINPDHPLANVPDDVKDKLPKPGSHASADIGPIQSVSLSGLALTENGQLKKSKYLNVLANSVDDYSDLVFSMPEVHRIRNFIANFRHGATAAIPIVCTGPHCPWASRCPYEQQGKAPLGRQCLLELNLMKQWQLNLMEEYQVDLENHTEITLLNELVEVEVHLFRLNMTMAADSKEAIGVVDQNIGFDHNGNPITQKQISQLMELREKFLARKHRIIKMLVGDRQEKYKREAALKVRESKDPSSTMAQLKEQMDTLQRELAKATASLLEPLQGKVVEQSTGESKIEEKAVGREARPLNPDDIEADDE